MSADQAGNIWVAGGEDGLFLLRPGSSTFQRFSMDEGLRPYGYMPDGSDPAGTKFLKVISVAGGPPDTVFVGYEGRPGCENNWDGPNPDPSIYKSGDADRVTVDATGKLAVVHYDIFSGPGLVPAEPRGREKLCTIFRIAWDPKRNDVWFGGNHGFALGDGTYSGDPKCNGAKNCSGVSEHGHPAFNGVGSGGGTAFITGDYRGVAVDPATGDVWFGGVNRTTKLHIGGVTAQFPNSSRWDRFVTADVYTEGGGQVWPPPACPYSPCYGANRIDVWPDAAGEVTCNASGNCVGHVPTQAEQVPPDIVFAIAGLPNGSAYVGSGYLGLRRLSSDGGIVEDATSRLFSSFVGGLAYDPGDGSLWVAQRFGGGADRLSTRGTGDQHYSTNTFQKLANMGSEDVQIAPPAAGMPRRVLLGFHPDAKQGFAGFIAVYSGN